MASVEVSDGYAHDYPFFKTLVDRTADAGFTMRFESCGVFEALSQAVNVETTFHMIKSKFGQRLRSRTLTAQMNEALCKVLCHNLCVVIQSIHELGLKRRLELRAGNFRQKR